MSKNLLKMTTLKRTLISFDLSNWLTLPGAYLEKKMTHLDRTTLYHVLHIMVVVQCLLACSTEIDAGAVKNIDRIK